MMHWCLQLRICTGEPTIQHPTENVLRDSMCVKDQQSNFRVVFTTFKVSIQNFCSKVIIHVKLYVIYA